jgi:hypothetical protein
MRKIIVTIMMILIESKKKLEVFLKTRKYTSKL